jgi:hypothetical protein
LRGQQHNQRRGDTKRARERGRQSVPNQLDCSTQKFVRITILRRGV